MKVRIYKSPDGNGKYLNKIGQFLEKAQLGGVPDVSEMGYPGSNSEEKKDLSQDELVNIISNDLNNDIDEQQIAFKLANFYDVDPMEAINLVSQVKNYLNEQNGSDYEYDFDEDENKNEEDEVEEEVVEEEPYESQEEVDAAEDTQNSSFVSDMLLNEDEEEDDDDEEKYGGQMAYGGLYKAQDGEEVEDVDTEIQQNGQVTYPFNPTAPGIVFPEIETYLPYNMADMLNGNVDPATGTYYNHYASKDINQNSEYEDEDNSEEEEEESDVSSEYALDAPPEMKMGGNYKRNKRVYVNSILKLAKKAEGGEEKKSDEDPEAGDPTGKKIRKQKLNNFISSLKKETEMFNLKQQAEQEYDQMMQQQQQPQNNMMKRGGPAGSRDPKVVRGNELRYRANQLKDFITGQNRRDREDNIDYFNVNDYPTTTFEEGDYNKDGYVDAMDFASSPEQLKLRNNTCFEDENGQTNCFPRRNENSNNEMHSYDHPSYSIDVRKSNWLTGKPSKYKIDFYGYSPLVDIANGNNSGVISQKPVVKPSQSTVSSTIATTINKSQSTDLPKQGTLLPHGFFTTDANSDKIPDYLQPGKFSTLPTGASKEVITQAAVNPNATVANTPIISSVYKPEVKRNSSPTLIEIKKNKVTVPVNPIPKFTTTNKKKTTTKKTKKKSDYYYRDPTFMERLGRFFDPNLENGGYVDSENPDLYEFNQGGYDPTQQDMDYSNSIDTTDPYFQRGGGVRKFIENYFPGNILSPQRTYKNEIQRVYDPRTGKTVAMPSNMGRVSSIDVQKSRFWSGKPKKYTINFNGSSDYTVTLPDKNNNSSQKDNKQNNSEWSNIKGLNLGSKIAIRKGELGNKINNWKLKRQGLDEYGNRSGDEQGAIYNDGRLTKDREGNWYDRNNVVIPGKKRPSEVPGYYDNNQTNTNEPMSNVEMLKKQGKIWDEKSNRWVDLDLESQMPILPTGQIYRKPNTSTLPTPKLFFAPNFLINNDGPRNPDNMQYGGNLDMYLPKKTVGGLPPCGPGEMLDPATNKCKAVSGSGVLKNNPPNGASGSPGTIDSWGGTRAAMNPNTPFAANPGASMKQMMGLDTESMKSFNNPDGTPIYNKDNDPYSIDVENKRDKGKLAFGANADTSVNEARLQTFNAGVDVIDGIRKNAESRKRENEMYENLNSNNLYASDPSRDRGDYDTNSGLYRPDEQGQMWNSRSKQFGGYIDEEEYYDPYTEEDEDEEDELTYAKGGEKITYMSEDQIRAFMAEGGQVEFL